MLHTLHQAMTTSFVLALVTAVLSLLLTKCLLRLLPNWGMVDKPDFKRHIHHVAVPRGGGLAIILSFTIVALVFFGWVMRENEEVFKECLRFLAPCAILVPLGICDDRFGLLARTKFLFQILAAALAWWLGFRLELFFGLVLPEWSCLILTILWIVGFINAFNMIDGVDGLAAGVGIISAVCMGFIAFSKGHFGFAAVLLTFSGSALGFLYYNWHPAKVFMGDTGSMFIGYVLAVSGLMLNARLASVSSIGIPLLACGIPVIDMLCAVWRRLLGAPPPAGGDAFPPAIGDAGQASPNLGFAGRLVRIAGRLGTADQKHLHHRLLTYFNRNQRKTVWSIYLLALGMGGAGILCCFFPENKVTFTLVILLCTFGYIINRLAFIELWQTTELAYHDFQSARAGVVISYFLNPLSDLLIIVFAYFVAAQHKHLVTAELLRYVGILMAVLLTSRSYRVFWNFSVSDDYFRLIRTLFYGFILARASDVFLPWHHVTRLHSYAACVAISLIMLERLGLHFLRNWQATRFSTTSLNNAPNRTRTLLYGVSPLTRFYRNRLLSSIEKAGDEELVGIIAIERRFLHSYCFGLKVMGTIDDLGRIVALRHINKIVITKLPPEEELERLKAFCQKNNLNLQQFTCTLSEL